jgi:hypothetical protein
MKFSTFVSLFSGIAIISINSYESVEYPTLCQGIWYQQLAPENSVRYLNISAVPNDLISYCMWIELIIMSYNHPVLSPTHLIAGFQENLSSWVTSVVRHGDTYAMLWDLNLTIWITLLIFDTCGLFTWVVRSFRKWHVTFLEIGWRLIY